MDRLNVSGDQPTPAAVEKSIKRARALARAHGRSFEVFHRATETPLAFVDPLGHVDATWEGSRYVTIAPWRGE